MKVTVLTPIMGLDFSFNVKDEVDTEKDTSPLTAEDWQRYLEDGSVCLSEQPKPKAKAEK